MLSATEPGDEGGESDHSAHDDWLDSRRSIFEASDTWREEDGPAKRLSILERMFPRRRGGDDVGEMRRDYGGLRWMVSRKNGVDNAQTLQQSPNVFVMMIVDGYQTKSKCLS